MKKVVFIDRDGTLIVEPPDQQIDSLEKLELIPGVIHGLAMLARNGYDLVMVSNQDGLGSLAYPASAFDIVQLKLLRILEGEGIRFTEILICPHTAADRCSCRKPLPGLLDDFLSGNQIDMERSCMVGDRETDVLLGRAIGCRAILLGKSMESAADVVTEDFRDACGWIIRRDRSARVERKTNETAIIIEVNPDGIGLHDITTGIGFFDHMLAQIARHSGFDITIRAVGDLNVDEHHTVEDTGLALGEAILRALGDKKGICRYGFVLPMDDAQARVAIDLGGRPFLIFDAEFRREKVGDFPTELTEEFFRAFSNALGANIHIAATGRNEHHIIESIFKGIGRALRDAAYRDPMGSNELPSTKGIL
ncbi:MAG: bifunctional histidinol-phosphatase/imidazoleglycerol-phosphate dehydratase HisB [Candidatus Kapaibacterium sp.]